MTPDAATILMQRLEALGQISDETGRLARTFCSPAMRRANDMVGSWMREAGLAVREDAVGNLIGHYAGEIPKLEIKNPGPAPIAEPKALLLGSHLDTVRDAGKFDGPLGVLAAIACVQRLHQTRTRLPFDIDVIGFADEEGVRYHSAYLGSQALAGTLTQEDLRLTDADGTTMAEAIRQFGGNPEALAMAQLDPGKLLGYAEVHIEQGPVLVTFEGRAGHAGTTPMSLRRDALCAAAQFILAVEALSRNRDGLVATVGEVSALPGASNVIPGEVRLSLDVRHAEDEAREAACTDLRAHAAAIAAERNARLDWQTVHQSAAVTCDQRLSALLSEAVKRHQPELVLLPSGAGHDAAALSAITPVAMLFVRCKNGVSHHPDESARVEDVRTAIAVLDDFLRLLAGQSL
jgi:allantoate deiminase